MNWIYSVLVLIISAYYVLCRPKHTRRDNYSKFHCHKLRSCHPEHGKPPVCGYNPKTFVMAQFPDMCTFHGVNCYKQGVYQVLSDIDCQPTIVYLNRSTDIFGFALDSYETQTSPTPEISTTTKKMTRPTDFSSTRFTIPSEFTSTDKPMRKGFSQYSLFDLISGFIDYLRRIL